MDKKYHIGKDGTPKVCTAKGECKLGGEHFNNLEEAQKYADKKNKEKVEKTFTSVMNNKDSIAYKVNEASDVNNPGFDNETFLSSAYAEKMGLNNALVVNVAENGKIETKTIGKQELTEEQKKAIIKKTTNTLSDYYIDKHNTLIADRSKLVKVVYYNPDKTKVVVQTGAPNVLDAAVVELDNKEVSLMEIKKGAEASKSQYGQRSLTVNHKGTFVKKSMQGIPKALREKLEQEHIDEYVGKDKVIDVDEKASLEYFVSEYKKAGASEIVFTNAHGEPVFISLKDKNPVKKLQENGATAYISIRTNKNSRKIDKDGIKRLNNNKKLFKNDVSNKDSFKLSDINKSEIGFSAGYIKMGEFRIEKINGVDIKGKYSEENLPDNLEIKKEELRTMTPQITGNIRFRKNKK